MWATGVHHEECPVFADGAERGAHGINRNWACILTPSGHCCYGREDRERFTPIWRLERDDPRGGLLVEPVPVLGVILFVKGGKHGYEYSHLRETSHNAFKARCLHRVAEEQVGEFWIRRAVISSECGTWR
jgi:hypothetical protein